jgi:hypothetical protein
MPLAVALRGLAAAFVLLVLVHVGVNGANGVQTAWVASLLQGTNRAVGLAMYNCIGSVGGCLGPLLVGALCGALGGYGPGMVAMGCCLAGAAALVLRFDPAGLMQRRDA